MLHLYNSLTRKKELFKPIRDGKIALYVCGITVYDRCHLGNARSMLCFDIIVRFLRSQGYDVTFVRNITDVDDKIINRANELGVPINELTAKYIEIMQQDLGALNILPPDFEPKATENISSIINLIEQLIQKGYAYISDNGDVCYQVACFKEYGKLAHKDIAGLHAGIRVEVVKEKRSPLDFVLWKKAKVGEPSWPSPWGDGRPGWHIECSAMATAILGEHFDIHGGGIDLQFPHHENEIAQSEAVSGKTFANYWLHVGMLKLNNEKMAKSTGNFLTVADALKNTHSEVIRYFLLSSHYRSSLNYTKENLKIAHKSLMRLYQVIKDFDKFSSETPIVNKFNKDELDEGWVAKFNQAMNDDFNSPVALAVLFKLSHEIYKTHSLKLANTLKYLAGILGLLESPPNIFLQARADDKRVNIESLIKQRAEARAVNDFATADLIRKQLIELNIELEDGANGTTWREKVK